MHYTTYDSPIGPLLLIGRGEALCGLHFPEGRYPVMIETDWFEDAEPFADTCRQLDAYFAGELERFDLPLAPSGTDFQLHVWEQLRRIPFGQTISYGELARRVGDPNASRAVGAANGRNPISIIVPCHRVIGADGSLTGFGGGIETKRHLLEHEQQHSGLFKAN
ncbi:MAG: methylated-DNA--[protein]-cysteine S-methyltransferase [Phycisphaeraceae bacterium]|nr:methylated-DNA--[protein]-cysteine S-methyltransferase [Phycisphaeraceae bacterium]